MGVPAERGALTATAVGGAIEDSTYRMGKLKAANNQPIWVTPNSGLKEAVVYLAEQKVERAVAFVAAHNHGALVAAVPEPDDPLIVPVIVDADDVEVLLGPAEFRARAP